MKAKPKTNRPDKFAELKQRISRGEELFPVDYTDEDPFERIVPFRWQDVKWREDFYTGEKRNIPCLVVEIPPDITVKIYGSHLKSRDDYKLTHLCEKNRDVDLYVSEPPPNENYPEWFAYLDDFCWQWFLIDGDGVHFKGSPSQRVFQKVMGDPDLKTLVSVVHSIKTTNRSSERIIDFTGRRLLKVLVPAIRDHNLSKFDLIKKVMTFCVTPRDVPKSVIYNDTLLGCARRLCRVPTGPELFDCLQELECIMEAPLFYRDLKEVGLGWLTKEYKGSKKS
jgi:hypothetical protein